MNETITQPARRLSPQKLKLSKWTAAKPANKEKHFMVVELVEPAEEGGPVIDIVLEAVHSRRRQNHAVARAGRPDTLAARLAVKQ